MSTYEQARKDHEYLWSTYGPASDMTGGYVDQEDLDRLLKNPTKATARMCYEDQIGYWFSVGPDMGYSASAAMAAKDRILQEDPIVQEIAERHGCV